MISELHVIRHLLTRWFRRPGVLWRGLGQGVRVITAMAACVVAALTGLLAGDLIRAMSPGAEPVQQIAAWILPVLLTYTVLRLFLEDEAALDFRPYLVLPFARRRLWLLAVLQTHLSWWNLFPISVALAFWSAEVVVGYPTAGSILFLVAVILTLAWTAFLVSLVREWIRRTPIWASAAAFGLSRAAIEHYKRAPMSVGALPDSSQIDVPPCLTEPSESPPRTSAPN